MRRRSIHVSGLEHGTNPIPAAARRGPLLATGAVRGVNRETGVVSGDPREQIGHAFSNLRDIVEAGGATAEDIVHVNVFVAHGAMRGHVNEAWVRMFPDAASRPARHFVQHNLPANLLIQLEALAFVGSDDES